jgi:hypothetical protein
MAMRTLDDVYGADQDRFPLEQEISPPETLLDWDDAVEPEPNFVARLGLLIRSLVPLEV